jgi:methionyl-tRNA synthetase
MVDSNDFPDLAFDEFLKLDLRVGVVLTAEAVPKSKKLLKLSVDFGTLGTRTIMAGVAEHYSPEAIVGLHVAAVTNLVPRSIMGVESHGMLLAGRGVDDKVHLVLCSDIVPGGKLG